MKHLLFIAMASLISTYMIAQTHTETFIACGKSYTSICEKKDGNSIKVIIKDGTDESKKVEFTTSTNDFEIFAANFQQAFVGFSPDPGCDAAGKDQVLSYARKLYFNFTASITDDAPAPVAGVFRLKDSLLVYAKTSADNDYARTAQRYRILRAKVEINEGYIESIKAVVSINGNSYYFSNYFGIGFSSLTNFEKLNTTRLFETHSSPYSKSTDPNRVFYYIKLSSLIDYDYDLALDRRDYSPQNIAFTLNGGESITLHKEVTKKLFEAHIFTDFIGLSEDKPNGLVQTEISKKINISTVQFQSPRFLYKIFKSHGVLQYVYPTVTISKLEQHNKNLPLGDLDSIRLHPGGSDTASFTRTKHRYATALDLYQYQHFSAGFSANVLFLSNHDLKYTFYLNAGVRLGITKVSDSASVVTAGTITKTGQASDYSVNTIQFYPEAILNFIPEERFSLCVSQKLLYLGLFNNNVQMLSFDKNDRTKVVASKHQWLSISELLMTIQVNENSKLFGRVRFNAELNNFQTNFAQVQVGYSVYILGNSKK